MSGIKVSRWCSLPCWLVGAGGLTRLAEQLRERNPTTSPVRSRTGRHGLSRVRNSFARPYALLTAHHRGMAVARIRTLDAFVGRAGPGCRVALRDAMAPALEHRDDAREISIQCAPGGACRARGGRGRGTGVFGRALRVTRCAGYGRCRSRLVSRHLQLVRGSDERDTAAADGPQSADVGLSGGDVCLGALDRSCSGALVAILMARVEREGLLARRSTGQAAAIRRSVGGPIKRLSDIASRLSRKSRCHRDSAVVIRSVARQVESRFALAGSVRRHVPGAARAYVRIMYIMSN